MDGARYLISRWLNECLTLTWLERNDNAPVVRDGFIDLW